MKWLALLSIAVLSGCVQERNVELELILRGSCASSARNQDISCLRALEVSLFDLQGTTQLQTQCTDVSNQFESLADLLTVSSPLLLLEDVATRTDVRLQIRGYSAFNKETCDAQSEADLLLWGSSGVVDLTSPDLVEVTVIFECRPGCDCTAIDEGTCSQSFQPGVCAPPTQIPCRRACNDRNNCFGERSECTNGFCIYRGGEMCASCDDASECNSNFCIENTFTQERFCADRCPPLVGFQTCADAMWCQTPDGTDYTYVP